MLTPAWIQAGGAILAVGVTVWLALLTRNYVRLTGRLVEEQRRTRESAVEEQRLGRESAARTADARVSLNAFAMRKALADWIRGSRHVGWGAETLTRVQRAVAFGESLLPRLEQGLVDASIASPGAAARLRTAYAHWQRAVMQFESYLEQYHRATEAPPHGVDAVTHAGLMMSGTTLLTDGVESFHACYLALEPVVESALLAEARSRNALPATEG